MSSATSTEDPGLRPWQFFLLAGMLSATGVVLIVKGQSPASVILLSVTVVAASLVALGAYRAFSPLVVPDAMEAPPLIVGRTRAALEREKTLALRSIKELEFDFAMKKISRTDFDEMGVRLRARAVGLMRQLDEGGYREEIEREVTHRLGATGAAGKVGSKDPGFSPGEPEDTAAARPEGRALMPEVGALMQCSCGTPNDPDARFCKSCGSRLAAE